jgi:hypothetical protein
MIVLTTLLGSSLWWFKVWEGAETKDRHQLADALFSDDMVA